MKIVVSGATGFIGSHLVRELTGRGDEVIGLSRTPRPSAVGDGLTFVPWTPPSASAQLVEAVSSADAVVNLAGEPIAEKRWSQSQKAAILQSRLDATNALVEAVQSSPHPPRTLISGSAIGYYGSNPPGDVTEKSPAGNDFLSDVCRQWEAAALKAAAAGVRVVTLRTGIVLGSGGGALPRLALPFKFFGGGVMGPRQQNVSWIHIDDHVGLILFALGTGSVGGPLNATAPNPVRMDEFSRGLGHALHRPVWVPGLPRAMKIALGERAQVVFASQRVLPAAALQAGYNFRFPELAPALANIYP